VSETRRGLNQKGALSGSSADVGLVEEKLAGRAGVPPMSCNEQRCLRSFFQIICLYVCGPVWFREVEQPSLSQPSRRAVVGIYG